MVSISLLLAGPVGIGPVLDGDDVDAPALLVDAVDHAVVPAPGAMQAFQPELERLPDPVRVLGQRPVAEFHHRGADLFGQPRHRPPGRCRPRHRVRGHRSLTLNNRNASSLLSTCPPPAPSSARPARMPVSRSSLSMMSSVSSSDSRSATLITTAAGCPCLVITTRPCSRSS